MASSRMSVFPALAVLLGIVMVGGGAMKLVGQAGVATQFATFGLPACFRSLVGTFEVIGGVLLLVPSTTPAGSLILGTIMVGAAWAHAANGQYAEIVPPAVLLILFLAIFNRSRTRAVQLLRGA